MPDNNLNFFDQSQAEGSQRSAKKDDLFKDFGSLLKYHFFDPWIWTRFLCMLERAEAQTPEYCFCMDTVLLEYYIPSKKK